MKNFAKSVLNYFAAFNETRFRFSRKLPYEWTDDSFTLDRSVFPDFQRKLVNQDTRDLPEVFSAIKQASEFVSYGYSFVRINKFTLTPEKGQTKIDVLNKLLEHAFAD